MNKVTIRFVDQKPAAPGGLAVRVHLRLGESLPIEFRSPVNFQEPLRIKKLIVDEIELTGQISYSQPG